MNVVIHSYISARDKKSRVAGRSPKVVAVARAIAHVKYIQHRPGDDKPPDGRSFFDETEENLDGRSLRKAIRELEDSKVVAHKLTLSPEVEPLDKQEYTREIMQKLAAEKGQELKWFAVEHNNTAHQHIHVEKKRKRNARKEIADLTLRGNQGESKRFRHCGNKCPGLSGISCKRARQAWLPGLASQQTTRPDTRRRATRRANRTRLVAA